MKKKRLIIIPAVIISLALTGCVSTLVTETVMNSEILQDTKNEVRDFFMERNTEEVPEESKRMVEEHKENWLLTLPEAEKWELVSDDGFKLHADFYPNENSHLYLISVHGFLSDNSSMLNSASLFSDFGDWNFLLPDCRAHGKSEGKYYGIGYLDSLDLFRWIKKITEYDSEAQIVLIGQSMGGATVLMASGMDIPENVKCIIADCAYSSVVDELSFLIDSNLHIWPEPILAVLEPCFEFVTGYSVKDASPKTALGKCRLPVLFIHGSSDNIVSPAMMIQNEQAIKNSIYEDLIVPGAGHGKSLIFDPILYSATVKSFVEKYVEL